MQAKYIDKQSAEDNLKTVYNCKTTKIKKKLASLEVERCHKLLAKEDVTAILDHFGLTESLNRKTKSISLKTLTSLQACRFHALFESGDFQQLKKPEWFEERWQSN